MSNTRIWATPDAHLVLPHNAAREVWLAERAKGVGGSDAAAVMGFNTWTSPLEVYYDKRGLLPPKAETEAMFWGKQLETAIAEAFELKTGIKVRRCGLLRNKERPWQQVSVDRLTSDGGGLEIKNMGYFRAEEWGDDDDELIPDAAEIQAMHCMAVTGKQHWWVMGLINGNKMVIRRVERRESTIAALNKMEEEFWFGYVQAGHPPPVDGSAACTRLLKSFYTADPDLTHVVDREILDPLVLRQDAAKKAKKAAEEALDEINNVIRDLAGDATALTYPGVDGKLPPPVFTLQGNGQFSKKRFIAEQAAVANDYTEPVTEVAVNVARLKDEQPELHARYRARVLRVGESGKKLLAAAEAKSKNTSTTKKEVA